MSDERLLHEAICKPLRGADVGYSVGDGREVSTEPSDLGGLFFPVSHFMVVHKKNKNARRRHN